MAVIVKYVVVRDGKEDMIFTTKKEADAYDKMLDIAEQLAAYLQQADIELSEDQWEHLTLFMAKNREPIGRLLKGDRLKTAAADMPTTTAEPELTAAPVVKTAPEPTASETGEQEAAKPSRPRKSRAAA